MHSINFSKQKKIIIYQLYTTIKKIGGQWDFLFWEKSIMLGKTAFISEW